MRALRYHDYGTEPSLETIPEPVPGPGEVLVRVEKAALNPLDIKLLSGGWRAYFALDLPYVMGSDFAGAIVAAGDRQGESMIGTAVVGRRAPLVGGAFADYAVVGLDYCAVLPPSMAADHGAAIPTAAGTAWEALFDAGQLRSGQTVLIHAAAGGVGGFAVQFAKAIGARVIATASGDGIELARGYGADEVIDRHSVDFADMIERVDLVVDTVGSEAQRRSFEVLRPGGRLVSVVSVPDAALAAASRVEAVRVYHRLEPGGLAVLVGRVIDLGVRVTIDDVYPFSDPAMALDRQRSGRARGKIILDMTR